MKESDGKMGVLVEISTLSGLVLFETMKERVVIGCGEGASTPTPPFIYSK